MLVCLQFRVWGELPAIQTVFVIVFENFNWNFIEGNINLPYLNFNKSRGVAIPGLNSAFGCVMNTHNLEDTQLKKEQEFNNFLYGHIPPAFKISQG